MVKHKCKKTEERIGYADHDVVHSETGYVLCQKCFRPIRKIKLKYYAKDGR